MGGCLLSVFKHTFWLVVIIVLCIIGAIVQCTQGLFGGMSFSSERSEVRELIEDREFKKLSSHLHDYFVDEYNAHPNNVDAKMGTLADEAIRACLDAGDVEDAQIIFRDYYDGLPGYGRLRLFRYMLNHGMSDSISFHPDSIRYSAY